METMDSGRQSKREHNQLVEVFDEETGDSESSVLEQAEEYRELEHVFNKLVVTNRKTNYGPPVQRTLKAGAHARKLGIRLKTAKDLTENRQSPVAGRQRLKTADPRLSSSRGLSESIEITPLPTDRVKRVRVNTAYVTNPPGMPTVVERKCQSSVLPNRNGMKSAPAGRKVKFTSSEPIQSGRKSGIDSYSSLAMYSPQTQRFTIERLAMERTRILKRLSHIQSHRIDKGFYVSGAHCDVKERYNVDEEQYSLLMEITNKGKNTDKKLAGVRLSQSVLQHFTPHPLLINNTKDLQNSMQVEGKRVGKESHVKISVESSAQLESPHNDQPKLERIASPINNIEKSSEPDQNEPVDTGGEEDCYKAETEIVEDNPEDMVNENNADQDGPNHAEKAEDMVGSSESVVETPPDVNLPVAPSENDNLTAAVEVTTPPDAPDIADIADIADTDDAADAADAAADVDAADIANTDDTDDAVNIVDDAAGAAGAADTADTADIVDTANADADDAAAAADDADVADTVNIVDAADVAAAADAM